jgi:hypothetical protein
MKSLVLAATAALVLGGSAMATAPSSNAWVSKPTAVSTDTCSSAKAKFEAAEKTHAKSPNLAKAKTEAKTAASECHAGKTADGVAGYTAAVRLLTA